MKLTKICLAFLALFITVGLNAQPNPEKKAKKFTDEITEVLSLSKEESKAVYKIQLDRINESRAIKKEYSNQEVVQKEKLKQNGNKVYNQMKALLGKERMQAWKNHRSKK